jgi:hypothetical protein
MGKRKPQLSNEWMRDIWTLRPVDCGRGELEHFDALISSAVARCLKDENRVELAGGPSTVFNEEISVHMLNAYASEARKDHKIPASRLLALIGLTRRFDILDALVREIGGKALSEHDTKEFRIGKSYVISRNAARTLDRDVANLFGSGET